MPDGLLDFGNHFRRNVAGEGFEVSSIRGRYTKKSGGVRAAGGDTCPSILQTSSSKDRHHSWRDGFAQLFQQAKTHPFRSSTKRFWRFRLQ